MELAKYWSIIARRAWLVILLTLVAFGASALYTPKSLAAYKATVKLAVKPEVEALSSVYGEYYPYLASEYLNDDIGKVIETGSFLAELQARAAREHGRSPAGSFEVKKAHRVLMVDATARIEEDALLLTKVAAEMLTDPNAKYFASISAQNPRVSVVDPPAVTGSTPASRVGVDIAVRTLLGFLAGIALVFLLDYLDATIRGRDDLEEMLGLAVLGEIPRDKVAARSSPR